jgi:hypothetical protein
MNNILLFFIILIIFSYYNYNNNNYNNHFIIENKLNLTEINNIKETYFLSHYKLPMGLIYFLFIRQNQ